ncbi:MAG: hypothetical protein HRF43_17810 [Phycisphaerae bacterium]|jgi:hypothetical protein
MKRALRLTHGFGAAIICLAVASSAWGAIPLLTPGDFILAIDVNTTPTGSGYAGGELPAAGVDANTATQYRNTGGVGSGFIITPWLGPTIVTSFEITTASDADTQDPASYELYGTNDLITSADNSTGGLETWTLISSGALSLPTSRLATSTPVEFSNTAAYTSYRMVFPTLRDGAATSMHFAEIQFFGTIVNPVPAAILQPGDFIIAIDTDPPGSASLYGLAEFPTNVRDGLASTKYLNFAEERSGFICTPSMGPTVIRSIQLTTANDAVDRDPASYEIYGTNDPIVSTDNSLGTAENWTLIASGPLALPAARLTTDVVIPFANETSYTSYKVIFPTVKNAAAANSMQIAEVVLRQSTDGTGPNVLAGTGLILAVDGDSGSVYTLAEYPTNMRDNNVNTKYLNFGEERSGFIAVPAVGPTTVRSIQLTTANDQDVRDPTTAEIYGTNDPVVSTDNSRGIAENWTLIAYVALDPPTARFTAYPLVSFANETSYTAYKVLFPTVRNAATANSMQAAEIVLRETTDNSGPNILATGLVIAVDPDAASGYPANENPNNIRDGNVNTKYLNNGRANLNNGGHNTGFISTPSMGATIVRSLVITTANDAVDRDPAAYALYGTNDPITSTDNSFGEKENWTLISSGPLSLPAARLTVGPVVTFDNSTSYTSYKMVFTAIKNPLTSTLMQVAEVGLFESTDGTGTNVLSGTGPVLAIGTDSQSAYPVGQGPRNVSDGKLLTKYLNSGRAGTGIIVTPSVGASVVHSLTLITANDNPDRDPASYALYGTNDPIVSTDNSFGNAESWTLISTGPLSLPDTRFTAAPVASFANDASYTSYKLVFPTIKDFVAANSMQIAELGLFESTDGTGSNLITSNSVILAIDVDSGSFYPVGERPGNVRDGSTLSKYRNQSAAADETNTGIIATPSVGPTIVRSMVLTTGNDNEPRDPASYALYGTNDPIVSTDNSTGDLENWTLISSGPLALPAARRTVAPAITFENSTSYTSYKLIFPNVKDPAAADSMQIAEIGLYESTDGTGASVLTGNTPILAIDADPILQSNYPGNESPPLAIDRTPAKYLNFGENNSGFIVTPGAGPSIVEAFRIITANDAPERDPLAFALYGTNDPIASTDNSRGNAESWTLIASGGIAPPTSRYVSSPMVTFSNDTAYRSYRMVFTSVRNADTANSMQITEIQFYGRIGVPCPTPFADADGDGDVDLIDFGRLQECITGQTPGYAESCRCFDRDNSGVGDGDIDAEDLQKFFECMTAPSVTWTQEGFPNCVP